MIDENNKLEIQESSSSSTSLENKEVVDEKTSEDSKRKRTRDSGRSR